MNDGPPRRGLGGFALVLHAHLPWVIAHGRWPHGESWLHEAAAGCWLPLLATLDRLSRSKVNASWTIGITPILLEQLAHPAFAAGFRTWLDHQEQAAKGDRRTAHPSMRPLASAHLDRLRALRTQFERGDLATRFARHARAGRIGLLTGPATHAYHPLLATPRCAAAQVRVGLATTGARLGVKPDGVWWAECAYHPGDARSDGLARLWADHGVRVAIVDAPQLATATPTHRRQDRWRRLDRTPPVGTPDDGEGWCRPEAPHNLTERGRPTRFSVLARHPETSERVWSADRGYPGDPRYLEFHRQHDGSGLKYWRITDRQLDMGSKHLYEPAAAADAIRDQAEHFARTIRGRLVEHRARTGRYGVLVAAFDAELFGHWWFEGPQFLEALTRRLAEDPEIDRLTAAAAIATSPPLQSVEMAESSWGANNDHSTWWNDTVRFYWDLERAAERRFLALVDRVGPAASPAHDALTQAARELLVFQASDWVFAIRNQGAVDYGYRRIFEHHQRFDAICDGVAAQLDGHEPDAKAAAALQWSRAVCDPFPDLTLDPWRGP
jgi:1,4-alpha-glucan branching enzyme